MFVFPICTPNHIWDTLGKKEENKTHETDYSGFTGGIGCLIGWVRPPTWTQEGARQQIN